MNEIGADELWREVRATDGYQRFVHLLHDTINELDGTRPIIGTTSPKQLLTASTAAQYSQRTGTDA